MTYNRTIPTAILAATLASCGETTSDKAAGMLGEARRLLGERQYTAAKDTILSMRKRYPEAIGARRQGILLLDSIEMTAATDSLRHATGEEWERLDVKRRFFERKLMEDLKK